MSFSPIYTLRNTWYTYPEKGDFVCTNYGSFFGRLPKWAL